MVDAKNKINVETDFLTLQQAFQLIGDKLFKGDWDDAEVNAIEALEDVETAKELVKERDTLKVSLEENGVNTESIKKLEDQLWIIDNTLRDLEEDWGDATTRLYQGILKLIKLYNLTNNWPDVDSPEYIRNSQRFQRKKYTLEFLKKLISKSPKASFFVEENGDKEDIRQDIWLHPALKVSFSDSSIHLPKRTFSHILILKSVLDSVIKKPSKSDSAEEKCQQRLENLFREYPDKNKCRFGKNKNEIKKWLVEEKIDLGSKAFERAWISASKRVANHNWSKSGRLENT